MMALNLATAAYIKGYVKEVEYDKSWEDRWEKIDASGGMQHMKKLWYLAKKMNTLQPYPNLDSLKNASVVLITGDNEILFLKRSANQTNAGEWDLPGGKIDSRETSYNAAVREFQEESGSVFPKIDFDTITVLKRDHNDPKKTSTIIYIVKTTEKSNKFRSIADNWFKRKKESPSQNEMDGIMFLPIDYIIQTNFDKENCKTSYTFPTGETGEIINYICNSLNEINENKLLQRYIYTTPSSDSGDETQYKSKSKLSRKVGLRDVGSAILHGVGDFMSDPFVLSSF